MCLFFSSKCQINIIEKYVKNILLNYNIYYIILKKKILYYIILLKNIIKKIKKIVKAAVCNFFWLKIIRNQYLRKYITSQCSKLSPYFSPIHNG